MKFEENDIVRVTPMLGCCNSTLAFQEWKVLKLFDIKVSGKPDIKMAVIESEGVVEISRVEKIQLIRRSLLKSKRTIDTVELA